MRVVVVAVDVAAVFDFAFEAVDGEVQAAEASGLVGFLDAVDGEFGGVPEAFFESGVGCVLFGRGDPEHGGDVEGRGSRVTSGFFSAG